jgi:hypothetical protein
MTTKAFRFPLKRSALHALGIPTRRIKPMSLAVLRVYNRLVNAQSAVWKDGVLVEPARVTRSPLSGFRKNKSRALTRINSQKRKDDLRKAFLVIDEMSKIKPHKDKEGKKIKS